jgi:glutamine amidotransferase
MCELLAMSTRHAAHLTFSLEALASRSGPASGTRDGWGAVYYQGNDVAQFRELVAASNSPLVRFLEQQGPSTTLAISHIRRATLGAVTFSNTQPFVRELAGRIHVFAHNGHLPGIARSQGLAFNHYHPVGDTDSEHAFCALLERMHGLWARTATPPSIQARLDVVAQFAADLRPLGPANFLYADAEVLFAHGHRRIHRASGRIEPPGLFRLSQLCSMADQSLHTQGVTVAPGFQAVTLIASVPLSTAHWQPFAEGETVAVSAGRVTPQVA